MRGNLREWWQGLGARDNTHDKLYFASMIRQSINVLNLGDVTLDSELFSEQFTQALTHTAKANVVGHQGVVDRMACDLSICLCVRHLQMSHEVAFPETASKCQ